MTEPNNLTNLFDDMVETCKLLEKFHWEVFSKGYPLCIKGKPIDHTTLNAASNKAQSVLRRIEALK